MRFALAISVLALSGVLLFLGVGQVTFLKGPAEITYSHRFDSPHGLAKIDAVELGGVAGQANVVVEGEAAFAAIGATRDVEAWLAPFAHGQVTVTQANYSAASPVAGAAAGGAGELELIDIDADADAADAYAKRFAELAQLDDAEREQLAALPPPSPYGSDLWLEQHGVDPAQATTDDAAASGDSNGEASGDARMVRLPATLHPEESVIVAVADSEAPATISLVWVQDRHRPWAGPLLLGGGLLAVIGAICYLLAVDHDRRQFGPRRGRRGPLIGIRNLFGGAKKRTVQGQRRRQALAFVSMVSVTLVLTACSPSYWPNFSGESEQRIADQAAGGRGDASEAEPMPEAGGTANTIAPVPVTQTQIERILADVSARAAEADHTLDTAGLDARFIADAFNERAANYTIRRAVADYEVVVPRITDTMLGYELVQSTETWPRTIFVVVAARDGRASAERLVTDATDEAATDAEGSETQVALSLALLLTQQSPHENFLVSRAISLRGGITMPEAAPAEIGTALLADDLQALVLTPSEVGSAYAAVLAGGIEVEQASNFDLEGDTLIERSGAAWVAHSTETATAKGEQIHYSVTAQQSEAGIVSLSTGLGGAILATTVLETRTEAAVEGERWRPTVPPSIKALSGLEGRQEQLVSTIAHQLLFFVPSATGDQPIQLLGYTSDLIAASSG